MLWVQRQQVMKLNCLIKAARMQHFSILFKMGEQGVPAAHVAPAPVPAAAAAAPAPVAAVNQGQVALLPAPRIHPRPLPADCRDEEAQFIAEFDEHIVELVRQFRRRFRCKQWIEWSIEYAENKEHSIDIRVKKPRS